jgi:hypothetical protein
VQGKKARAIRRRLLAALIIVVIAVGLSTAAAVLSLIGASAQLASEQARSSLLETQRAKYVDVTTLQNQVDGIIAARPIAAAGQILWSPYMTTVAKTLPKGMTITDFSAQLAGSGDLTSTATLLPESAALITITADAAQAPIPDWLDSLTGVPGYIAAVPGTITLVPETGRYTVGFSLLVSDQALAHQFDSKKKK